MDLKPSRLAIFNEFIPKFHFLCSGITNNFTIKYLNSYGELRSVYIDFTHINISLYIKKLRIVFCIPDKFVENSFYFEYYMKYSYTDKEINDLYINYIYRFFCI